MQTNKPLDNGGFLLDGRGGTRTPNQWLKRPLLDGSSFEGGMQGELGQIKGKGDGIIILQTKKVSNPS